MKNTKNILLTGIMFLYGIFVLLFSANLVRSIVPIIFLTLAVGLFIYLLLSAVAYSAPRPLLLSISIYTLFYYLIPGIFHLLADQFPFYDESYSEQTLALAALVALMFSIFFAAGYLLKKKAKDVQSVQRNVSYLPATFFCMVVSIGFSLAVGYSSLNIARGDLLADVQVTPIDLIVKSTARIAGFLCFMFSILNFKKRKGFWAFFIVVFSAAVFIASNNPTAIPRYVLGSYFIAAYFILFRSSIKLRLMLLFVMIFSQVTIFPMISNLSRGEVREFSIESPVEYYLSSGDFDGFQSTANVVDMVASKGLFWGKGLASAVFFFVPRTYWASKSIGTGGEAALAKGYSFINLSSPMPAELYVDFGFVGLLLFSFLLGRVVRVVDLRFVEAAKKKNYRQLVLIALTCGYSFILMRGSLVGVLGPFCLSVGLCYVATSKLLSPSGKV